MSKFCLKYIAASLVFIFVFVLIATPAYATRTITSATLNGSGSVTVAPSASITAVVNVTTVADGSGATWGSTKWTVNGVNTCVDHPNHTTAGSYSETFSITAPVGIGTYDVTFTAYVTNACGTGPATYTLSSGIVIAAPTSTPAPTSPPTATPATTAAPGQTIPTPTPDSSSDSGNSGNSTPSTIYYPSVNLAAYSPNPTNKTPLSFSGTAVISQGTIQAVEYTITDGANWIAAQPQDGNFNGQDENFTFTISNLAEGKYAIKVRAKSGAGVFTQEEQYPQQVIIIATTPPVVTLNKIMPNPTNNQTPTLTGQATAKLVDIAKVEMSIDNGKSWNVTKRSGNTFSIKLKKLEDGNYPVIARAFDSAGNIGQSAIQMLIIDTIPPIIGGGMQSVGPQLLTPDRNGIIRLVAGTQSTLTLSMKGGVTQAKVETQDGSFDLQSGVGSNLWSGNIKFEKAGEEQLKIVAVDGAGNKTERSLNAVLVENFGKILDKETQKPVEDARVAIYFFETQSQQWLLWEGASYGQINPQKTALAGAYSFMVPAGRYYLEVTALGYHPIQSEILNLQETTILNYQFPLASKPKIVFNLPVFGKIVLTIPSIIPQTFRTSSLIQPAVKSTNAGLTFSSGTLAPKFTLPNLNNEKIGLTAFKGKAVLLSFISPWSSQSLEQAVILSETSRNLSDKQSILVISLQESIASTETFMKRGNYKFEVLADKDGDTSAEYKITLLPEHFFIDKAGRIQEVYVGVLSEQELVAKLLKLK
ncbi:MAG: Thioredoxin protein [Candidatus Levybacteria bacterium]|nr:Thioredoxin protein [Candidatus Levybacteria bacterium]